MARSRILGALAVIFIAWMTLKWSQPATFDPDKHIRGKNVIVTGASSGIGREMALLLCEMGANVYITARRENLLQEVMEKCKRRGLEHGKFGYVIADMASMDQAVQVVKDSGAALGSIDYLILNHALVDPVQQYYEMTDGGFEHLRKMMDVNFYSFVKMTQAAMPYLLKSNGSIGIVSSLTGEIDNPLLTEYGASKHAINGFYGALDLDFYTRNINVSFTTAILGLVDTPLLEALMLGLDESGGGRQKSLSDWPVRPPSEAARIIIRSTALREPIVYFPNEFFVWGANIISKFFPYYWRDNVKYYLVPK